MRTTKMFKTEAKICANCGKKNPILYKKCISCKESLNTKINIQPNNEDSIVFKRMSRMISIRDDLNYAVTTMNLLPENLISYVEKFRFLYLLIDMAINDCEICISFLELLVLEGKATEHIIPMDEQRSEQMLDQLPNIQQHLNDTYHQENDIHTVQRLVYNFGIHMQIPELQHHHPDDDWEEVPAELIQQYELDGAATDDQLKLIEVVPDEHVSEDPTDICVICMNQYKVSTVVKLPCGHLYHSICIMEWLKKSNKCPLGRCPIKTVGQLLNDKINK